MNQQVANCMPGARIKREKHRSVTHRKKSVSAILFLRDFVDNLGAGTYKNEAFSNF